MKKFLFSAVSMALLTSAAAAADLPSRKAEPLPVQPPPPMWTGFYVGLNAGGTWANSNALSLSSGPVYLSPVDPVSNRAGPIDHSTAAAIGASGSRLNGSQGGFIGGGQIGYNWQFYNSFVAGIEADIQGVAGSGGTSNSFNQTLVDKSAPTRNVATIASASQSLDYIGTVRGRVGYLIMPNLLVYGTGGLAYGGVSASVNAFQYYDPIPANRLFAGLSGSFSNTQVGWSAGGGIEWMFMSNWSAKVEYLYYDLGTVRFNGGISSTTGSGVDINGLIWANANQAQARFNGNIARVGVNYHFNIGDAAPIIAKF